MLREAALHSVSSAITLALATLLSLAIAWQLGPSEFGRLAGFQAIYSMLGPLVALRLDTRVAVCKSEDDLVELLGAICSCALLFALIGAVAAIALSPLLDWRISLMAVALACLGCLVDALLSGQAFLGQRSELIIGRALRQILPSTLALLAVVLRPDYRTAAAGSVLGIALCLPLCLRPLQADVRPSIHRLRVAIGQHAKGLSASMVLAVLNALWLNGLLPILNVLGLSQVAGQYALVQRLLGAPLAALTMALSTVLVRRGNVWHLARGRIAKLAAGLFAIAAVLAILVDWVLHGQRLMPMPAHWVLDRPLYLAVSFFLSSSFAVGSLSIIGIRQRDEWFLVAWQLLSLLVWGVALLLLPSAKAFEVMLILGGLAYWVLVGRWVFVSGRLARAHT